MRARHRPQVIGRESLIRRLEHDRQDAMQLRRIIAGAARPRFLETRARAEYRAGIADDAVAAIDLFLGQVDELACRAATTDGSSIDVVAQDWVDARRPIVEMVRALPPEQHWALKLFMMPRRRADVLVTCLPADSFAPPVRHPP